MNAFFSLLVGNKDKVDIKVRGVHPLGKPIFIEFYFVVNGISIKSNTWRCSTKKECYVKAALMLVVARHQYKEWLTPVNDNPCEEKDIPW